MPVRSSLVAAVAGALAVSTLVVAPVQAGGAHISGQRDPAVFHRLSTYPVFQNLPDGVDSDDETVAEISDVSADGKTLAYTDAAGGRIGFLNLTNPKAPVGLGTHDVSGGQGGEPTSVAIVGKYALVVVDDTDGDFPNPAGRLDIVTLAAPHKRITSIDLGGQPDSIAISPDGAYAAIAMENQRDEEATPPGGEEGDLPQPPSGFVQTLSLAGKPKSWSAKPVRLRAPAMGAVDTPQDVEPEYVDINDENQLSVTLQENNGVAIIDLPTARLRTVWSAGSAKVKGVDADDDGLFDFSSTIKAPREPDAIQWVGDGLVATANEGDWKGGTRGWTVFKASTGKVIWDAGASFENIAVADGLFNNDRADDKGTEPEGLAFDTLKGTPYAFVGSERSNFVAVYDMTSPRTPRFVQGLPTTMGPEGLLPVPSRSLLVVSSEEDSAEDGYRAAVGIYRLGNGDADFPSIVSVKDTDARYPGTPIGWTALGALSGDPKDPHTLWAATDAAAATGRIYRVDVGRTPAVITAVREVHTPSDKLPSLDIEGLDARDGGGFWAASEGDTGPENTLLRLSGSGEIRDKISLPGKVASRLESWGLEGVTSTGHGTDEQVYVALQRPLADESFARIGRYTPATGKWSWFGYPLEKTDVEGDWIGLSEVTAVNRRKLAVIERDKQAGPKAAVKRIYTVKLPDDAGMSKGVVPVTKKLAHNVLPDLQATNGWTQEKLEGLAVARDHRVYTVTDNDGLENATGETVFLRLGRIFD